MTPTKTFILKAVPSRFHHGALAACRTLGRLGIPVAANGKSPQDAAANSRYCSERVVWAAWPQEPEEIVERLVAWGRRQDDQALLLPVDDVGAILVDDYQADLRPLFRIPAQPTGLVRRLSSKWEMAELAKEHGVSTARVERVGRDADLADVLDRFDLPVVIKRIAGWSPEARSTPSVSVAHTREEAYAFIGQDSDNILVQEYIAGGSSTSWMFNGYFDQQGRCLFGLTGYKLRQFPPTGGTTTLGQLESNEKVRTSITTFLTNIGYRGIVDVGLRFDATDGSYKLLDVNPRVGSTFRLFVDQAGNDVVRVCYADLNGRSSDGLVTAAAPRQWQVEPYDLWTALRSARSPGSAIRDVVASTLSVDERAWWAVDDLKPVGAASGSGLTLLARRGLHAWLRRE